MARKCLKYKASMLPKFSTRSRIRCRLCGRPRGVFRKFDLCRLCFRELSLRGEIPGIIKSSW